MNKKQTLYCIATGFFDDMMGTLMKDYDERACVPILEEEGLHGNTRVFNEGYKKCEDKSQKMEYIDYYSKKFLKTNFSEEEIEELFNVIESYNKANMVNLFYSLKDKEE